MSTQPDPKQGIKPVLPKVLIDFLERAEKGREVYGRYLEAGNGRDAVQDAYEEAMDLTMYLAQVIIERGEAPRDRLVSALFELCPDHARYIAADSNGTIAWYAAKPVLAEKSWVPNGAKYGPLQIPGDWKDSLIKRP